MLSINYEVEIKENHKVELTLPDSLSPGKHQLVVVVDEKVTDQSKERSNSEALMKLAGTVDWEVDGVEFQRKIRDEEWS